MLIRCPHCGHRIMVRNAKPRTYTPSCQKCHKQFGLMVEGLPGPDQRAGTFKSAEEMKDRILQAIAIKRAKKHKHTGPRPETPAPSDAGTSTPQSSSSLLSSASGVSSRKQEIEQVTDSLRQIRQKRPDSPLLASDTISTDQMPDEGVAPGGDPEGGKISEQELSDLNLPKAIPFSKASRKADPFTSSMPDMDASAAPKDRTSPNPPESPPEAPPESSPQAVSLESDVPDSDTSQGTLAQTADSTIAAGSDVMDPDRAAVSGLASEESVIGNESDMEDRPTARPESPLQSLSSDPRDMTLPSELAMDPDQTAASRMSDREITLPSGADRPPKRYTIQSLDVPDDTPGEGLSGTLGGYQIEKLLGRGGMGSVYLAKQLSLDRLVAVKTMNPQWARNPIFFSRFIREAYAAAQLVHHHVVQIYDMDEDKDTHFFSMEYVPGQSLGSLVEKEGPLESHRAAGYILQAARGLKFAHDHGMIHRDIKPDNLMLNPQGIVKIADLGLVKTPEPVAENESAISADDSDAQASASSASKTTHTDASASKRNASITRNDVAMGTPAYMAPEQARDARHVDARADIYSLGCTFYTLLTALPVFEAETIEQLRTKHATQPLEPPQAVLDRLPSELWRIIQKMVAKDPDDRYQDMGQLIVELEEFLGIRTAGRFSPQQEHVEVLEQAAQSFNHAKAVKLRQAVCWGFHLLCGVLVVGGGMMRMPLFAGGVLGLWGMTQVMYFVLTGVMSKTFVFRKVRQYVLSLGWKEMLGWAIGLLGAVGCLALMHLLWMGLWITLGAMVLAAGMVWGLDRQVATQQAQAVEAVRQLLKTMRLKGLEEQALRRFVCQYVGQNWEPLYETLFGYEDKCRARQQWGLGDDGKMRKKHAAWRDGVIAWINKREHQRTLARQRKHLAKIERGKLQAQGMDMLQARRQAQWDVDRLLQAADTLRRTLETQARESSEPGRTSIPADADQTLPAIPGSVNVSQIIYGDEDEYGERQIASGPGLIWRLAGLLLGARMRLLVGFVLIGACVLWMHQNNLLTGASAVSARLAAAPKTQALHTLTIMGVPQSLAQQDTFQGMLRLLSSYSAGMAGLILVFSAFLGGVRMTAALLPGVTLLLGGPVQTFMPLEKLTVGPLAGQSIVWTIGGVLCLLGLFFGRSR